MGQQPRRSSARRKMGLAWPDGHALLSLLRGLLQVQADTLDVHETGLALAGRHDLSIYDAMIVAAALHADCDMLWSEDMQDGMAIEGRLRIANPFEGWGKPTRLHPACVG